MNNLFGEPMEAQKHKFPKKNWERRFQGWSNKNSQNPITDAGKCGYGSMCEYCDGEYSRYGKPCVKALNTMLREENKEIDYETAIFGDVWSGAIWRE